MPRRLAILLAVCVGALGAPADTAAVLPFANMSTNANLDWIGESIAATLRDAFAMRGIVTISREDVQESYRRVNLRERALLTEASVIKIGETVDAQQLIYGTFEFQPPPGDLPDASGSLKVSVRLLDRRRLRESPQFSETGSLQELATIEAHLAWQALSLIAPNLTPPESEFKTLRMPVRLDAEENYIRGLMARAPDQREKYFTQAARLDARFAHPSYELGQINYQRKDFRQAAEWLARVGPDDLDYHPATFLLGLSLFQSGDYAGAQKAFQTVAMLTPLSEVFNDLAAAESRRSLPQAVDHFRKALEGDPNDPMYLFNLGYVLWKKGDFGAAADNFRATLDRAPDDSLATLLLGRCLKKQGFRADQPGDARLQALERLKTNYDERAYRELKSMLSGNKKP